MKRRPARIQSRSIAGRVVLTTLATPFQSFTHVLPPRQSAHLIPVAFDHRLFLLAAPALDSKLCSQCLLTPRALLCQDQFDGETRFSLSLHLS